MLPPLQDPHSQEERSHPCICRKLMLHNSSAEKVKIKGSVHTNNWVKIFGFYLCNNFFTSSATGAREYFSTTLPSGLPKWLINTTLWAPLSKQWRTLGKAATILRKIENRQNDCCNLFSLIKWCCTLANNTNVKPALQISDPYKGSTPGGVLPNMGYIGMCGPKG